MRRCSVLADWSKKKAIAIFSEYQHKAEALMRDHRPIGKDEGLAN